MFIFSGSGLQAPGAWEVWTLVGRVFGLRAAGPGFVHPKWDRASALYHFKYLPMIGASSRFTAAGTASGLVIIAVASALAHGHARSVGTCETASAISRLAVSAFWVRLRMIISTVTASWSGCQQS